MTCTYLVSEIQQKRFFRRYANFENFKYYIITCTLSSQNTSHIGFQVWRIHFWNYFLWNIMWGCWTTSQGRPKTGVYKLDIFKHFFPKFTQYRFSTMRNPFLNIFLVWKNTLWGGMTMQRSIKNVSRSDFQFLYLPLLKIERRSDF